MAPRKGQRIGYARVSSADQNLVGQLAILGDVDRLSEEKRSGAARTDRIALADLIGYGRTEDTVVVSSMDRPACSVANLTQ